MASREICLWLDERWYAALSKQLEGGTVEDKLDDYVDHLIGQLPEPVREESSREIRVEEQQRREEIEASKVFSAFHVREKAVASPHFTPSRNAGRGLRF